jgi:Family of unknown function (DUF6318)
MASLDGSRHHLRVRRIGLITLFAAFVAGCTSSSSHAPGSTSASSPSTSTAPSSTAVTVPSSPAALATPTVPADVPTTGPNAKAGEKPPVMPIAATQHTAAGAQAFAKFFIQTIDWGYATTSTTYMRHHFVVGCVECRSVADSIDRDRKKGHHFIGDRFTIRGTSKPSIDGAVATQTVTVDVTSVEIVTSAGGYVGAAPALTGYKETISEKWQHGGWVVTQMAPQ